VALLGPLPRQRLYTLPASYWRLLAGDAQAPTRLERALAAYVGTSNVALAPMARTGISLALKALIPPGGRVLMSPYTIADVVNMVLCAGGVPVFCDIERATCNISLEAVRRRIDDDIACVLATHFYGLACDIEAIAGLCRARGIPLVEDCAQALGTRVGGRMVGTFGDAGIFSFGLYKSVTGFFGGAVVSARPEPAAAVREALAARPFEAPGRLWRQAAAAAAMDVATFPPLFRPLVFRLFRYGYLKRAGWAGGRFDFDRDAVRYADLPERYLRRMSPGQCRAALARLGRADADARLRMAAAERYHRGLADIEELLLPPLRTDGSHTYHYFPIQYAGREALVDEAMRRGRDIALSHHRNCADLPCFAPYAGDCPNARATADELIYLPTYPGYGPAEIDATVATIRRFFGRR